MSIYGATKAFVLFLSQGLNLELSPSGVYVQAVLPAATRTEIWERAGIDVNTLTEVMEVGELVDAALVGFDRRELVTIPPLHVAERWDALDGARQGLMSDIPHWPATSLGGRLPPHAGEPRLLLARQACGPVKVLEFEESRIRHVLAPCCPIVECAVAAVAPAFLIRTAGIGAE